MGKEKYQKQIEELFKKSPIVDSRSIDRAVKNKKESKYTKQLIRNLLLKGKIKKLTKGFYTASDNPELIIFCLKPAYFGLQDALSFHNLWEQETVPVIITSRRVRQGIREVMGTNVLIRRIDKKYFFGFMHMKSANIYYPYSDIEKTLIDMVYFNEPLNGETIKAIKKRIDNKKLNEYLKQYSPKIRKLVFNAIQGKNTKSNI